jgi:hypothetical protein
MRIRRIPVFLLVSLLATALALGLCEAAVRVFLRPPLTDRIEVIDKGGTTKADCYPRAPGVSLPVDLGRAGDAMAFFHRFRTPAIVWPGDPGGGVPAGADSPTLYDGFLYLLRVAPLCVVYDFADNSPRRVFGDARGGTWAVLGDSFGFGQGVRDEDTFTTRLASLAHVRIRSFAKPGANIPEIEREFDAAMKEQPRLGFTKIIYMYVLNDPFATPQFTARLEQLNDFMNERLSAAAKSPSGFVRFLGRASRHSALAVALLRAYTARQVAQGTLDFYRELNDPARNPGMIYTFAAIDRMRRAAEKKHVEFDLVVYPLMLDFGNYPLAGTHAAIADMAARHELRYFDLLPAFRAHAGEALTVHPIDHHPNAAAQAIAARAVAEHLGE